MEPTERYAPNERSMQWGTRLTSTVSIGRLVSSRIRGARLAGGLDEKEMADRLGNAVDSFCDLESYDDEAFTVPTLAELAILGHVVGVEPKELLLGEDVVTAEKTVTLGDIAQQLAHRMADSGITSEQLGREIGFSVEPLLRRRDALWDYSVEALYQICGAEFAPTIVRTSHRQPSRSH